MAFGSRQMTLSEKAGYCVIAYLIPLLSLGLASQDSYSRKTSSFIEGRIFDQQTLAPLPDVSILIESAGLGDASDSLGNFRIGPLPPGQYSVAFLMIGYRDHAESILLGEGETISLRILLPSEVLPGGEVIVERPRIEKEPWMEVTPSFFEFRIEEATALPSAFSDVLRALQTLPGVLAVSDYSNQLIVRGGDPNQNLILLDGIEFINPYTTVGIVSSINPVILESVRLHTGGFPALYGDRLSSVLDLTVREGTRTQRILGEISAGLSGASVLLEGSAPTISGSWLVTARRTFFELFADSLARALGIANEVAYPQFWDFLGKLVMRPSEGHRVQLLGFYNNNLMETRERETLGEQGDEGQPMGPRSSIRNFVLGATWVYAPNSLLQGTVSANGYHTWGQGGFQGALGPRDEARPVTDFRPLPPTVFEEKDTIFLSYHQNLDFRRFSLSTRWILRSPHHILEMGSGADGFVSRIYGDLDLNELGEHIFNALRTAPNWLGVLADSVKTARTYHRWHAFVQDRWSFWGERLLIQPGLRYDYHEILDRGYLSPRINLSYRLHPSTSLRMAWGHYVQSPSYEKLYAGGDPLNLSRYGNLNGLVAEEATHIVTGLRCELGSVWQLSVDGYLKYVEHLVVQQVALYNRYVARYVGGGSGRASIDSYRLGPGEVHQRIPLAENGVSGTSHGVDLLLERRLRSQLDRWYGWFAYAYNQNIRHRDILGESIDFPADYDRRHALDVVLHYRLGKLRSWDLGLTWRYGTGLPFTPATSMTPLVINVSIPEAPSDSFAVIMTDPATGYVRFIPTFGEEKDLNSGRISAYHRLDIRLARKWPWRGTYCEVHLDIINVYNRRNVFYYRNRITIEEDTRDRIPLALRRPPTPVLFREPVYMYPFILSLGFAVAF